MKLRTSLLTLLALTASLGITGACGGGDSTGDGDGDADAGDGDGDAGDGDAGDGDGDAGDGDGDAGDGDGDNIGGAAGDGDGDTGGSTTMGGQGGTAGTGGNGSGGNGTGGSGSVDCVPPDDWWGLVPPDLVASAAYSSGTGIDTALAAAPAANGTTDVSGDPITIEDAIVTAVGYYADGNPDQLWLENASGAIRTFAIDPGSVVEVGDLVTLVVTEIGDYAGWPQITGISSFTVTGSGEDVLVREWNDVAPADRVESGLYHTFGEALDEASCGAAFSCITISTEQGNVRMRGNPEIEPGDCVELVSPLGSFDGDEQLEGTNFSWSRVY